MATPITHTLNTVMSAIAALQPPPVGRPQDLRAHAVRLRQVADRLSPAQGLTHAAAQLPGSDGPAADRARDRLRHEQAVLDQRVQAIRQLAAYLDHEAGGLQASQQAWVSRLRQRTLGVPAHLVDSALRLKGWRLP